MPEFSNGAVQISRDGPLLRVVIDNPPPNVGSVAAREGLLQQESGSEEYGKRVSRFLAGRPL
jgi:hypothetical protein